MNKWLVVLLVMVSACHTQAPRVHCDLKLQPINAPAPVVKEPSATSAPTL
ncbi:MAG: hypothetical protein ACYDBZ_00655 [Steroidobacteraceae bacterium]